MKTQKIFLSFLNPFIAFKNILVLVSLISTGLVPERAMSQGTFNQTKNVFIVVIDGIRNDEAFESGNQYMRFLWDSLRPKGTIYTNFRNSGVTVTNSGHSTIVTGVRQYLPNNSGIATPIRPKEPTLGECYRKQLGIPKEQVYYISGKSTIWRYPVSLYPGYGYSVAPTITLTSSQDTLTWDSTKIIMDRDHPSLSYVLFAQVDAQGHTADTIKYLTAIRRADSLIYLLWKNIESDPVYAGTTTMLVTSDHGRHDDAHGGWQAHGDYCHGCRHIPFFAIGPDIQAGTEIPLIRDQIDIAPTVAHLLGFDMPLAQGSVMSEMLISPNVVPQFKKLSFRSFSQEVNLSNSSGISRSPSIAVNKDGLHVIYTDNTPGQYETFYIRSSDFGASWSTPMSLFSFTDGDDIEADIASVNDTGLFVAVSGYRYIASHNSYVWTLMGRRSTNSGVSWESESLIDTLGNFSCKPSVSTSGSRISIVTMSAYRIMNYTSINGGVTFSRVQAHSANSEMPSGIIVDTTTYAVWHHLNSPASPYWNILWDDKPWQPAIDKFLSQNDTNSYSYDPSIAYDNKATLYVAYSHLADASAGNSWGIRYSKDANRDGLWSEPAWITENRTCFSPIVKVSGKGIIYVVWADMSSDGWGIWGSRSTDEGTSWSVPYQVTSTQSFIAEPDIELRGDTMFAVWQDLRDGNWEIYSKKSILDITGSVQVDNGWNMVSLPVVVQDGSVGQLFPSAISSAFEYGGSGYFVAETLRQGKGYWLKFNGEQLFSMEGLGHFDDTISVKAGWNMIGSMTVSYPVKSISSAPPGITTSQFFKYHEGYEHADTIEPGRSYWVQASEAGKLILGEQIGDNPGRIHIIRGIELPPSPPNPAPDTISGESRQAPDQFALEQNYPNPFNPTSTIKYNIPIRSFIKLNVMNSLGQEVAQLVGRVQEAGSYEIRFDGTKLTSGVYFYRIMATSTDNPEKKTFTDVKKFLFLK